MSEKTYAIILNDIALMMKGGMTDISNCMMLCKTHNRAKGNKKE